jgi:hypothetical protein
MEDLDDFELEQNSTPESATEPSSRPRRKKRRKRRRKQASGFLETFRYYTEAFGAFPWILLGLLGVCVGCGGVSLLFPAVSLAMIGLGVVLYLGGWCWFVVVAFKDDSYHGVLCMVTHFYWPVYLFLNLEEAWKPTAIMVLGILVAAGGGGIFAVTTAHPG